jgi:hypothetical protein
MSPAKNGSVTLLTGGINQLQFHIPVHLGQDLRSLSSVPEFPGNMAFFPDSNPPFPKAHEDDQRSTTGLSSSITSE